MSEAPFIGSRIIDSISFEDIEPLIDKERLFAARWEFKKGVLPEQWDDFKKSKVEAIYEKTLAKCRSASVIEPKAVYGYFKCRKSFSALMVEGERKSFRFEFPREKKPPHRSVADYFPDEFAAFQIVTVGKNAADVAARMFSRDMYSDAFYIKGLAAEAAEALAVLMNKKILAELGFDDNRGARFSPGYPSFPDLLDQKKIVALLGPARIGVSLTKTCVFVPEYTTSAIISADPNAVNFNPNL